MKHAMKLGAISALALAGFMQPAFAASTLHVFLWDSGADVDMVTGHKIGDGADNFSATMGVTANALIVPAGKITFDVLNVSTDTIHEMVVSKLDGPDGTMPYNADIQRVDEDAFGSVGEVSELDPGDDGQLTVSLDPGTYALYCNIPGHFAAGMWTILTVE